MSAQTELGGESSDRLRHSPEAQDEQPAKKAKLGGGLVKRMKPASPPKAARGVRGPAKRYVDVDSASSDEGGSLFVDD